MSRHIKTGDTVMVITGADRGKTGRVLRILTGKNRVVVEGINRVWKHHFGSALVDTTSSTVLQGINTTVTTGYSLVDSPHFGCYSLPAETERFAAGRSPARRCYFRFIANLTNQFDDFEHL